MNGDGWIVEIVEVLALETLGEYQVPAANTLLCLWSQ